MDTPPPKPLPMKTENGRIPLRAIFALNEHKGEDWGELRAMQLAGIERLSDLWLGIAVLLSLSAALTFVGSIPANFILAWATFNCMLPVIDILLKRRSRPPLGHRANRGAIWKAMLPSLAYGFGWALAVPMILYSGASQSEMLIDLFVLESIGLVIMLICATSRAILPGLSVGFNFVVAVPLATAYFMLGHPLIGAILLAISAGLSFIATRSCLSQLRIGEAEQSLREKNETVSLLLREFEDTGADWLWQTDTSRCLMHVSPRFAHALGCEPADVEGQAILPLVAGDSWESGNYPRELHEFAERMKRRESFSNLILPVMLEGQQRWWELSASPRFSEEGDFLGFRGVGSDVTEQWESQKKISRLARFDTLTSLPNRLQITEALSDALSESHKWKGRCAFLMIDLDRFKQVNDTLGHQIGDRLLAKVAERLDRLMSNNELCGRLGGDEFAVVLKEATDGDYIDQLATKIIAYLSQPYEVDAHAIYIGASIGSAVGPRDGHSVEMLMRSADLALYRSKEAGRGVHNSYQPKLHAQAEERRLMEVELRKALDRKEFHLVYQPVVDAVDGSPVSFEALLRWRNSVYGDVSPGKFVPLAEEANLILPIGEWTLRKACRDAAHWPDHIRVAVNVSAEQLMQKQFTEVVVRALRDADLPARRLEIEVTESLFLREGGMAGEVLDQLQALGVQLSLDDFGTGYSSFGYLRKTRFDTIKIDKSFVEGSTKGVAESLAIIRAVIAMADSLDMSTTAEGVESEDQFQLIRKLGCRKIQGYLFGRPMPIEQTLRLFENRDPTPEQGHGLFG